MRRKTLAISCIAFVLIAASFYIGGGNDSLIRSYTETTENATVMRKDAQVTAGTSLSADQKMIIFSGYVSLEIDDPKACMERIVDITEKLKGYIAGSQVSDQGSRTAGYVTIRVPKNQFREAISRLSQLGRVISERTASDDITERYTDLRARIENLQRQERRLQELLSKTTTVTEILAVEKELERVRGQVESLQGQVNYLERNVEMALITIQFTTVARWFTPPAMNWGEAIETALRAFFLVVRGLIILIMALGPFALIASIAVVIYRRAKRPRNSQSK